MGRQGILAQGVKPGFGERLREARKRLGLTQAEMERHLGSGPGRIRDLENERTRPTELILRAIAAIFDIDIEWLRNGDVQTETRGVSSTSIRPPVPRTRMRGKLDDEFPDRLRATRMRRGMTQLQLAQKVGVTKQHIRCVERRKNNPSNPLIVALAAALDVDEQWLRTGGRTCGSIDESVQTVAERLRRFLAMHDMTVGRFAFEIDQPEGNVRRLLSGDCGPGLLADRITAKLDDLEEKRR